MHSAVAVTADAVTQTPPATHNIWYPNAFESQWDWWNRNAEEGENDRNADDCDADDDGDSAESDEYDDDDSDTNDGIECDLKSPSEA